MNIIQIGANKGYDDITDIINHNLPSCLILVEPFIEHNESLKECYKHIPNCYIENVAIVDNPDSTTFRLYYHISDTNHINKFELASFNKDHFKKVREKDWNEEGMRERIVPSITINQLFDKYNLLDIDLLYIDTEGFDDKIIESINFDKYNIKEIYYENLHINTNELHLFLKEKKYNIEYNVGHHGWSNKAIKI